MLNTGEITYSAERDVPPVDLIGRSRCAEAAGESKTLACAHKNFALTLPCRPETINLHVTERD